MIQFPRFSTFPGDESKLLPIQDWRHFKWHRNSLRTNVSKFTISSQKPVPRHYLWPSYATGGYSGCMAYLVSEAISIEWPERQFPCFLWSLLRMRKRGGNNKETGCLYSLWYQSKSCTQDNHSAVKTTNMHACKGCMLFHAYLLLHKFQ